MKKITIEIAIDEITGKMGTAIKAQGYDEMDICSQLEMLGVLENLKNLQSQKIIKLAEATRKL